MPTWPEETGPLSENELCPANCPHLRWRLSGHDGIQRPCMGTIIGVQSVRPVVSSASPECWFPMRVVREHLRGYGARAIKSWTCPMEKKP